jgi:dihydrofolate reductase
MSKLRVHCFSVSVDGYGAGPNQSVQEPLGVGGEELHGWFAGRTTPEKARSLAAADVGQDFIARSFAGIGATIMGRNMFGPVRGPWPDHAWTGWWGANPPFHTPVFVLTHHARPPVTMQGGTTFHFVTDGIHAALSRAREAAQDQDIRVGGGVATVKEYLRAGLVDEMHIAISPIFLGSGESLFAGIDLPALGLRRTEHAATPEATHIVLARGA